MKKILKAIAFTGLPIQINKPVSILTIMIKIPLQAKTINLRLGAKANHQREIPANSYICINNPISILCRNLQRSTMTTLNYSSIRTMNCPILIQRSIRSVKRERIRIRMAVPMKIWANSTSMNKMKRMKMKTPPIKREAGRIWTICEATSKNE
jgi:hypothetical protein